MQTLETIVARLPLFIGMKPEHQALLCACAAYVHYEPGESLGHCGESADRFWVVLEGEVALALESPARGAVVVQTVGPDDVLGWSWLLPPHQLHFDMRALVPTRALVFQGECVRRRFAGDHELAYEVTRRFLRVVADRLEATTLELQDLATDRD